MRNKKNLLLTLVLLLSNTSCQPFNAPTPPQTKPDEIKEKILSGTKGEKLQNETTSPETIDLIKNPTLENNLTPDSKGPNLTPDSKGPNLTPDSKGPNLTPDSKGPNLTPDSKGPNLTPDSKGPTNVTLPPLGITIPPLGFTFPPRGFSAIKGAILLPSRFKESQFSSRFSIQTLSSDLNLLINNQTPQGNVSFYGSQVLENGSLILNYFVSQIAADQDIQLSIVTANTQQVLLKALTTQNIDGTIVNQNLNTQTTAVAIIKEEKPSLKVFDILTSPQLNEVQISVEEHLSKSDSPDINKASDVQNKAQQTAQNIIVSTKQVSSVTLPESILSLKENTIQNIKAMVNFDDSSTSNLVLWTSNQPDVAIVDNQGFISALKPGEAILTATALADFSQKATLKVQVESLQQDPNALQAQMIQPIEQSNHSIGSKIRLESEVINPAKTEISQIEFKVNGQLVKNSKGESAIIKWKTDAIQILSGLADFTWDTSGFPAGEYQLTFIAKALDGKPLVESKAITVNLVTP